MNSQRIFLDSNVILDIVENRDENSKKLLDYICLNKIYCCTSVFAHAESIDKKQEFIHIKNMLDNNTSVDKAIRNRGNKRLSLKQREDVMEDFGNFFNKYNIVTWDLDKYGWEQVIEIMRVFNIKAPDSIHLAVAMIAECTIFTTKDEELLKVVKTSGKILGLTPKQTFDYLKK